MPHDNLIDAAGEASCKQQRWLLPHHVELIWHQVWHLAGTEGPPNTLLSCPPILPSYHAILSCSLADAGRGMLHQCLDHQHHL